VSEESKPGGFVEQVIYAPGRLWGRVEDICERPAKEPSEVIAEALRLMLSGGVPTAPASVGGTTRDTEPTASNEVSLLAVDASSTENLLALLVDEPLESSELREPLEQD
jgi:hypothetical protein